MHPSHSEDPARFSDLTFDDFRRLALAPGLSPHERIGFPDSYRDGYEEAILDDVLDKLPNLRRGGASVLEIGPGCGPLPVRMAEHCEATGSSVVWVDSGEMLGRLPELPHVTKVAGHFPACAGELGQRGSFDAVLAYSVFHYCVGADGGAAFLDGILDQLAPGGHALIGDIPNVCKRRRFFSSDAGRAFHRAFTGSDEDPVLPPDPPAAGSIDDHMLLALVARARAAGFHAHLVEQAPGLPMANRREDLLVVRP